MNWEKSRNFHQNPDYSRLQPCILSSSKFLIIKVMPLAARSLWITKQICFQCITITELPNDNRIAEICNKVIGGHVHLGEDSNKFRKELWLFVEWGRKVRFEIMIISLISCNSDKVYYLGFGCWLTPSRIFLLRISSGIGLWSATMSCLLIPLSWGWKPREIDSFRCVRLVQS